MIIQIFRYFQLICLAQNDKNREENSILSTEYKKI